MGHLSKYLAGSRCAYPSAAAPACRCSRAAAACRSALRAAHMPAHCSHALVAFEMPAKVLPGVICACQGACLAGAQWRAWNRRSCAGRLPLASAGCAQGRTGPLRPMQPAGGCITRHPCPPAVAGPLGEAAAPHAGWSAVSGATACDQPVVVGHSKAKVPTYASMPAAEGCDCAPLRPAGARLSIYGPTQSKPGRS